MPGMRVCLMVPVFILLVAAATAAQEPAAVSPTAPANSATALQSTATIDAEQPTQEQIGDALMARQRYQAALAAYAKAPQDSAMVLNKMGMAYQMLFDTRDALRFYKASLKINPKNSMVYNNLGTVYDSLKQYGQAEKAYRKAIKLSPKFALAYKNLGSDLMAQHNYRKGSDAYRKALGIDPEIFQGNGSLRVQNPASVKDRGAMNYYMARGCARSGQIECVVQYLRLSMNEGFVTPKQIVGEPDFASMRGVPAFEELLTPPQAQRQ